MPIGIFARQKITPLIRVLDSAGSPIVNVTTSLNVTDLVTQVTSATPICDKTYRHEIAGTLEYIRMNQVCRVMMNNFVSSTDSLGLTNFPDFVIES